MSALVSTSCTFPFTTTSRRSRPGTTRPARPRRTEVLAERGASISERPLAPDPPPRPPHRSGSGRPCRAASRRRPRAPVRAHDHGHPVGEGGLRRRRHQDPVRQRGCPRASSRSPTFALSRSNGLRASVHHERHVSSGGDVGDAGDQSRGRPRGVAPSPCARASVADPTSGEPASFLLASEEGSGGKRPDRPDRSLHDLARRPYQTLNSYCKLETERTFGGNPEALLKAGEGRARVLRGRRANDFDRLRRARRAIASITSTTFDGLVVAAAEPLWREERAVGLDEDPVERHRRGRLAQVLVLRIRDVARRSEEPVPRAAHSRAISASPLKQWRTTRSAEPSSRTRRTSGHASRTWTTSGLVVTRSTSAICVSERAL